MSSMKLVGPKWFFVFVRKTLTPDFGDNDNYKRVERHLLFEILQLKYVSISIKN